MREGDNVDLSNYIEKSVALLGLLIAGITLHRQYNKSVYVEWSDDMQKVPIEKFSFGNLSYLHKKQNKFAYICSITIINNSNIDIGFYDMVALNPYPTYPHMIMMRLAAEPVIDRDNLILEDGQCRRILCIPENTNGVFKANSSTRFDIVVTAAPGYEIWDEIQIVFRVTYKSMSSRWNSLLYSIHNKKWYSFNHTFSKTYRVSK